MADQNPAKDDNAPAAFKLKVGTPRDFDPSEIEPALARFADLGFDPETYKQSGSGKPMPIKWVISPDNAGGKAKNTDAHGLHLSLVEAYEGITPPLHFHEYREIFIPISGKFGIFCGKDEHLVEIGPLDTFSVPKGILRRPELLKGNENGTGLLMVIFDTPHDPYESEFVPPEQKEADVARGLGHMYEDRSGVPSYRRNHRGISSARPSARRQDGRETWPIGRDWCTTSRLC